MSFSPRYIGDTRSFHCTFDTDSSTLSVVGATLQMHFVDTSNSTHTVGTGTWSNQISNTADYTPSVSDVISTTAGTYSFYPTVNGIPMDTQIIEIIDPTKAP